MLNLTQVFQLVKNDFYHTTLFEQTLLFRCVFWCFHAFSNTRQQGNAQARFSTFFSAKSFNDFKAEALKNKLSGDKMHEFIYTRAKENILSSSIGCFIKGTLVKIPGGWKPIDELKVGDLVMSRPENGIGEAVAKKVVNTFRFENKEIWHVGISDDDLRRGFSTYEFAVTPNHPFCVYGVATNLYFPDNPELTHEWEQFSVQQYEEYRYDDYYDDETGEQILYSALHTYMQDDDTEEFKAFRSSPYEITLFDTPVWKRADQLEWGDVLLGTFNNYCVVELSRPYAAVPGSEWAWLADDKRRVTWQKEPLGHYIEFNLDSERFYKPAKVKNKNGFWFYTRNDEGLIRQDADGTRHYLPYLATVYNIEVEDYHTYCVGYEGFLVHNDNCGISRLNQLNPASISWVEV